MLVLLPYHCWQVNPVVEYDGGRIDGDGAAISSRAERVRRRDRDALGPGCVPDKVDRIACAATGVLYQ